MKYEGHFLLWYLILMPFAKLGFPYITTNIISWIIVSISVLLILKRAPFKFYKRILLISSFPFLYLFPIISRCYCLIPLAVTLMCIFYKDRKQKPFRYLISIVILVNTHIVMLGMSGIVLLDYILELISNWKVLLKNEKKVAIISLTICIILLIVSILPLIGCLTTNQDILYNNNNILTKTFNAIVFMPLSIIKQLYSLYITNQIIINVILLSTTFLIFCGIKNCLLDTLKIWLCILWQCAIYSFIYSLSPQRASTVIFILLYFIWTNKYKKQKPTTNFDNNIANICCIILISLSVIQGLLTIVSYEIKYNYSNAYKVGNYINNNIDNDSIILNGSRVEYASSIIPYVNKDIKFYHIEGDRYFSYAIWDNQNKTKLCIKHIENLANIFDKDQKLYYIHCTGKSKVIKDISTISENNLIDELIKKGAFKQIFYTDNTSLCSEDYIMYEVILENL